MSRLGAVFVPFNAQTRMSGVNLDGREIRKGAADTIDACMETRRANPGPKDGSSIPR